MKTMKTNGSNIEARRDSGSTAWNSLYTAMLECRPRKSRSSGRSIDFYTHSALPSLLYAPQYFKQEQC